MAATEVGVTLKAKADATPCHPGNAPINFGLQTREKAVKNACDREESEIYNHRLRYRNCLYLNCNKIGVDYRQQCLTEVAPEIVFSHTMPWSGVITLNAPLPMFLIVLP